jgi:hypothetical protein
MNIIKILNFDLFGNASSEMYMFTSIQNRTEIIESILIKTLQRTSCLGSINHNKITWKLQNHFDLVYTCEILKTTTSPNTGMSGVQFLTLKSAVINE